MGVYIYQSGTENELKNAYIGEYRVPGANTILYLPLESDLLDYSQNQYTMTTSGTITKADVGYSFGGSGRSYLATPSLTLNNNTNITICFWQYFNGIGSGLPSAVPVSKSIGYNSSPRVVFNFAYYGDTLEGKNIAYMVGNSSNQLKQMMSTSNCVGVWRFVTGTLSDGTMKLYIDGVLENTLTSVGEMKGVNSPIYIGSFELTSNEYFIGKLSKVIIEDKTRTAQEISDYYNSTKSNYGL